MHKCTPSKTLLKNYIYLLFFFIPITIFGQLDPVNVLDDVIIHANFSMDKDGLITEAGINLGQPFDSLRIPAVYTKLYNYLQTQGYLFARIDSIKLSAKQGNLQELHIFGVEGNRVYFGDFSIQSDSILTDSYQEQLIVNNESIYSKKELELTINRMLALASEQGYPFAQVDIDDMKFRNADQKLYADISIRIAEKDRVYIKDFIIIGNNYTRNHVILRELGINSGDVFSKSEINEIPRRLLRLGLFKDVKQPLILSEDTDSVSVQIEIEEGSATTFDGVIGYIPEQPGSIEEEGYFTGQIDLTFNNLFGTARQFDVHWEKPDRLSEDFHISYTEPWVFGYPLNLGGGLDRTVRDTTYIEWIYQINSTLRLYDNLNFIASFNHKTVYPDSLASREQGLLRNSITSGEIGIEYDTRDYKINPRSGLYYKNTYSFGTKTNHGPDYLISEDIKKKEDIQQLKIWFSWFYNLWSNQVFSLRMSGKQIQGNGLQLSDYYWIGGSRTVRGYREKQFWGSIVAWANLEYRFVVGRNSRIFVFNDWGFYSDPNRPETQNDILAGYGAGVRFDTPLGILGVDYGLGKDDPFSQGKIHFGIINRF